MTILRLLRRASGVIPPPTPVPPTPQASNTIGCAETVVSVFLRGGEELVLEEVPFGLAQYNRILTATSEGSVTVDGLRAGAKCRSVLQDVHAWSHELAIYRDGVRVWRGPVTEQPVTKGQDLTIKCKDLSAWFARRFIRDSVTWTKEDVATIWLAAIASAMRPDTTPRISVTATPTGILTDRVWDATSFKIATDELDDLTKLGIDWTVIDSTVLGGGIVIPTSPIATLLDEHLVDRPDTDEDGLSRINRMVYRGAQPRDPTNGQFTSGSNVYGEADSAADQAVYGLLEGTYQDDDIQDAQSAALAAAGSILLTGSGPIIGLGGSGMVLTRNAPVTMSDLVPGASVAVAFLDTWKAVAGSYRLLQVAVQAEAGRDQVAVSLQPLGAS